MPKFKKKMTKSSFKKNKDAPPKLLKGANHRNTISVKKDNIALILNL